MSLMYALLILLAFGVSALGWWALDEGRAERRAKRSLRNEHRTRMAMFDMSWQGAQVRRAALEPSPAQVEAQRLQRAETATKQLETLTAEIAAGRLPDIPFVAKPKRLKYRMRGYGGGPNHTSLHPRFWNQVKTVTFVPGIGHCRTTDVKRYRRAIENRRVFLQRLASTSEH